jgi:uncharacterized protein YecT (DUF1311 family)
VKFPRKALPVLLLAIGVFSLHNQSAAQSSDAGAAHAPDPDSGIGGRVEGLYIPTIAGQPFRAKVAVSVTRHLPDGTEVAQKYYTLVARDNQGRVHREFRQIMPADSEMEPALLETVVYDPVGSLITTCYPERRTCRNFALAPPPTEPQVGPSADGKSVLERESIGAKTLDGLQAQGTRETLTFAPGSFGNDKPVVVTKEYWYSPQLQVNLTVTRMDPRNSTQHLEMQDLKLGDPGADWFRVPDGYRVVAERVTNSRSMYPAELAPLIEKSVTGLSGDELNSDLAPVEAAIGVYVKAHVAAAPHDDPAQVGGQLRQRLSMDLHMMQNMNLPQRGTQLREAGMRLKQAYTAVLESPCINKQQPGDPKSMPTSAAGLEAEEQAWEGLETAWTGFMAKLFPNGDRSGFAGMLTSERDNDLRRYENVERNRGCLPVESIAPLLEAQINGMTPEQIEADVKPVDAAIAAFAQAHAAASPNDRDEFFIRQTQQVLIADVRSEQEDRHRREGQLQQTDAQLNQTYQAVITSPCLSKAQPGDPPSMPKDEDSLRAEERAWINMRDVWTAFLVKLFPNAERSSMGWQLTSQRTFQLQRIGNVERNRGCIPEESIEPLLAGLVHGLSSEQLATAAKPVDEALNAFVKAHAESAPNDRNEFFARQVEQSLISDLSMQQQNRLPTQDQFEEADLHLNQAYRGVIGSPCLAAPIPADPPNAPVSDEKLRAEERAWVALRDVWAKFMADLYPNAAHGGFGTALTEERVNELQQIRVIEQNRGCRPDDESE